MPSATTPATFTVALIGNPNTGKSTLFNALAGVRQRVGNYPGVTVEKKTGLMTFEGQRYQLIDLPGTYSLAPRSPDEMVAVDVLLRRRPGEPLPDAVLCIVDAANLQRNLYLVSQLLELGLPTVVALNMIDVAEERGLTLDVERLEAQLGVPVVPLQANRRRGIDALKSALHKAVTAQGKTPPSPFPPAFQQEVDRLAESLAERELSGEDAQARWPRFLVERLLLDTGGYLESLLDSHAEGRDGLHQRLVDARGRLAEAGAPVPAVEAISRYGWVGEVLEGVVTEPDEPPVSHSDQLDRVLTHWLSGTVVFALLMAAMFITIFLIADLPMTWIDDGVGAFGEWVGGMMSEGAFRSLIVDGVIGGVGAVVIFLPQILMLFFFIAVMEDCGYMARAAYLMDRLMSRVGLSGKSFIPLLSSFACAIPGIMAARVIENPRDRLTTVLVAPLMSCSARLPVYAILIAAFIPKDTALGWLLPGLTLFAMYALGVVVAVLVALVLKKTLLKGATPPFVMELPAYKFPSPATVLHRMGDRGWAFLRRAGTLIFAMTIIIWALGYYPRNEAQVEGPYAARLAALESVLAALPEGHPDRELLEEQRAEIEHDISAEYLRQSYLGRMGQWVEPVVRPLGWDWRIGCAAIASFPAREVVMSTLSVIYHLGEDVDVGDEAEQARLGDRLKASTWDDTDEPVYNIPVALSLMVFFALCAQCAATLAVIKRETNTWRWPLFTFGYMTTLAYVGALLTYQIGIRL